MNKFSVLSFAIMITFFLLSYYGNAGSSFQIFHLVIGLWSIWSVLLFRTYYKKFPTGQKNIVVILLLFCLYIIFVDLTYSFIHSSSRPLLFAIYVLSNTLFALLQIHFIALYHKKYYVLIFRSLFVTILLTLIVVVFGLGYTWFGGSIGWYSNPNQLGYSVVLMVSILSFVYWNEYRFKKSLFLIVILSGIVLVAISGSRMSMAAYIALLLINVYKMHAINKKISILIYSFTLMISMGMFSTIIIKSGDFNFDLLSGNEKLQYTINKIENLENSSVDSIFDKRGISKIWNFPEYIIFGSGDGNDWRFVRKGYSSVEVHSLFPALLFTYGFVGLFLFLFLLYRVYKHGGLDRFAYLIPPFIYCFAHNGLRNPLLILLILLISFSSQRVVSNRSIKN